MAFLILLFFLVFTKPIFADSSVKITGYSATSPEYVELTNTTSADINLEDWSIKDDNSLNDDILLTSADIIPANSAKQFTNTNKTSWLNDSGDIIYLYDNNSNQIDKLIYPTPTLTKTPTPTTAPTSDPADTNPTSGISLTEFMPYSSVEWIEIYNNNDYPVKLVGWKLGHNSSTTKNFDISIGSKSYATFDFSTFLNNNGDTIILYDNNNNNRDQRSYEDNKYTLDRSWSLVNNSWCQTTITKGSSNATSCYTAPTSTPTPTPTDSPVLTITPTPDQGKYVPDESATASAIIDPIVTDTHISTTPPTSPALTTAQNTVLGTASSKTSKRYLPLILIISGGCLLVSPLIIDKIKKQK